MILNRTQIRGDLGIEALPLLLRRATVRRPSLLERLRALIVAALDRWSP